MSANYGAMQKQSGQVCGQEQDISQARKLEKTKEKESIMAKGVKHYFKNGKEHTGATHKDAKGRVMSGARHTAGSKYVYHAKELSSTAKKKVKK